MSTTTNHAFDADADALNAVFAEMETSQSTPHAGKSARPTRTRISSTSFDADDTPSRNRLSIFFGVVSVVCFSIGLFKHFQASPPTITPRAVASVPSTPEFKTVTRNIEDFDVGMRAAGRNPLRDQVETLPEPDPETSRKLLLRMTKEGGLDLKIRLLRPIAWLEHMRAVQGGTVFLELPEMGAVGDAYVEAVLPCPPIADGPGHIVTGVFEHEADPDAEIISVKFANGAHIKGVTGNHPFYSEDRNEFVPVGEMREGETVQVNNGTTTITEISARTVDPGTMLYNLETHSEHVFQVTLAGVLVHNSCTTTVIGRMDDLKQFDDVPGIDTWRRSGRIPSPDDPPVNWAENLQWLEERIARGDKFGIATDPSILPPVRGGRIPGVPNGYFTARELEFLRERGIDVLEMF